MTQPVNYRDVRAFSQSSLKLLDFSVTKFYREEYKWVIGELLERPDDGGSDAMTLGSIVDLLLTRPDDLDKEYVFIKDAPTGQLRQFIEAFRDLEVFYEGRHTTEETAKIAYDSVGFKREKLETVVQRFQTEGLPYYNQLRASVGKKLVNQEVLDKARALVKMLEEDEYTGPIVTQKTTGHFDQFMIEVWDQLPIYWEEHGLKFKALLDKVIVNHEKKTIQPYDIKTTGSNDFREAFSNYRYDIQGAFYSDALHHFIEQQGWKGYSVLPFVFIVVFTNDKGIGPQLWKMSDYDYVVGKMGHIYRHLGNTVITNVRTIRPRGYQTIINDLLWHIKENRWKYPKEVYLKNGLRELNYYVDAPVRS